MKVEVELTQETYEAFRQEAEERKVTVGEIVRERVEPKTPWNLTPVNMGGAFLMPLEDWRLAANERPDDE